MALHYRFDPPFCLHRKGQEKSDVERTVDALERRASTPVPRVRDVQELNRYLLAFCDAERSRMVRGQTESIGVRFDREKSLALPLPPRPFDACVSRCGQSDKYQTVLFENNRYSVPRTSAFAPVTLKAYIDRIRIVHGQQVVATHSRSYGEHESVLDPMHYLTTLSRKPACLDHASVFRDWRLPAVFDELRHTLERAHGPRTGVRHYIRVLQLLRSHPASRIETAIRRCRHRQTLTAEIIAEKALSLMSDGTDPKDFPITPVIECRVQVPMSDLRRFDQLLSFTPEEGDATDVRSTTDAFEAQPQDPATADHPVGVRPAVT